MSSLPHIPTPLLEKYRTSAPRYTSYPTAIDWTDDFVPESYPASICSDDQTRRDAGRILTSDLSADRGRNQDVAG